VVLGRSSIVLVPFAGLTNRGRKGLYRSLEGNPCKGREGVSKTGVANRRGRFCQVVLPAILGLLHLAFFRGLDPLREGFPLEGEGCVPFVSWSRSGRILVRGSSEPLGESRIPGVGMFSCGPQGSNERYRLYNGASGLGWKPREIHIRLMTGLRGAEACNVLFRWLLKVEYKNLKGLHFTGANRAQDMLELLGVGRKNQLGLG